MNAFQADPAKTYAVVVGIESYSIPDANLDGPVRDACRFVRWLRAREVPAENIQLFASALERNIAELEKLDVSQEPAKREPIRIWFTEELPKRSGDLLFLFWGGHGLLTAGRRRLIYADATLIDTLNLDLDSLLYSLHCDLFAGLPRQVSFIDACANHVETLRASEVFPCERYETGCEQFVLFGAKPGELSKNDNILRSGVFSSAVLDDLERQPAQPFPPDIPALADRLTARFLELQEAGQADQTPAFWSLNWGGTKRQDGQIPPPKTARLIDAYISPRSVFERLQLDRFVGRTWLVDKVDAFLRDNDRGYFILEANAGLGKTAFLAYLVRERGYIQLFAEQARRPGTSCTRPD